jgi:hypothetical protein
MRRILLAAAFTSIVHAACAQPQSPAGPPNFDTNNDGVVTREEFSTASTARFAGLDANDDGRLTGAELTPRRGGPPPGQGGDRPPPGAPGDGPPRSGAIADENGDGVITRSEFLQDIEARFADLDRNHDGRLTGEEAPRPPRP